MKSILKKLLWLLVVPFFFNSCWSEDDFKHFAVEPIFHSWVFPLVDSDISFKEIVERSGSNTLVQIDDGTYSDTPGLFYIAIYDTMSIGLASSEFPVVGFSIAESIVVPLIPTFGTVNLPDIVFEENHQLVEGQDLKQIDFHSGEMDLILKNNYNHSIAATIRLTSLINNTSGLPFTRQINLGPQGSASYNLSTLAGYSLNLFNGNNYNNVKVEVVGFTITENTSATNYSGSFTFNLAFNKPQFETIEGRFNKQIDLPNQSLPIVLFNATVLAEQYFANPMFNLSFESTYGVPLSISFPSFQAINSISPGNAKVVDVQNKPNLEGDGHLMLGGEENVIEGMLPDDTTPHYSSFGLNVDNSNVDQVFFIAPNTINFDAGVKIGDNSDNYSQFIKRNSFLSMITDIVIPLDVRAVTHELSDTIRNIPWPDLDTDLDYLEDDFRAVVKFKITNELPLNMLFRVICLDEDYNPVYSLVFSEQADESGNVPLGNSAPVGPDGIPLPPDNPSYLSVNLSENEYKEVQNSSHLLLYYRMFTGGEEGQSVKVMATNKINVNISLHFSGTINLDIENN